MEDDIRFRHHLDTIGIDAQDFDGAFRLVRGRDEPRVCIHARKDETLDPVRRRNAEAAALRPAFTEPIDEANFWLEREERRKERNTVCDVDDDIEPVAEIMKVRPRNCAVNGNLVTDAACGCCGSRRFKIKIASPSRTRSGFVGQNRSNNGIT